LFDRDKLEIKIREASLFRDASFKKVLDDKSKTMTFKIRRQLKKGKLEALHK